MVMTRMLVTVPKQNWEIVLGLVELVKQLPKGASVEVSLNEEKAFCAFSKDVDITGFPLEWQQVMTVRKFNEAWKEL